jgi:sugar lactone lactonase YvrE
MSLVLTDAVRKPALLRRAMVAAAAAAALGIGAPAATAATATPTSVANGAFGSAGTADGQFTAAMHLAVAPTTRNVLVADSGNGRVQVFAPGGPPTFLTSFGAGTLTTPVGIAIDQATGAVYVSDSGANQIFRFTSDGAATPTYTPDVTYLSPTQGAGSGQVGSFTSAIAVDPVSHDLLVADTGNNRVDRFTSTGAPDALFLGAVSLSGSLMIPRDIAVGLSGEIYVVDAEGPLFFDPATGVSAASHVRRYSAVGAADGEMTGISFPSAVGVDPLSGRVMASTAPTYVDQITSLPSVRQIYTFAADGTQLSVVDMPPDDPAVSNGWDGQVRGLAMDGSAPGRLYALIDFNNFGDPSSSVGAVGVQIRRQTAIPGVDLGAATAVGETTAHLGATVAAGGVATTAHIEYSLNGTDWTSLPDHPGLNGTGEQTIEDGATGLRPNSDYSVRAFAANADYSATSSIGTFRTAARAPLVETAAVSDVQQTSATLTGRLTPLGSQSTYYFEYGETAGYGRRVPANVGGVAGNGFAPRAVTQAVKGLKPGTVYHYRLVGTNATGTAGGTDETFTTDVAGAPARTYEMVSPTDKQGVPVDTSLTGTYAREDGNAIMYATGKTLLPDAEGGPMVARVLGTRSADAWANRALDVPLDNLVPNDELFFATLAVSKDFSRALVVTQRKLTADAVEGTWNLYLREPAASPLSAKNLTLVATDDRLGIVAGSEGNFHQVGTSDDARHFVFTDASQVMYEASVGAGGLRVVSELPDGTVTGASVKTNLHNPHQVSADGSRIYFSELGGGVLGAVWLRENGTTTVPISVSHRPGDPATPIPAYFVGASFDGRYSMFVTGAGAQGLTPDAPNGGNSAYRYDLVTDSLSYVASNVDVVAEAVPAAGDLYFRSPANLTGSPDVGPYLYRGHGGTATLIAALGRDVGPLTIRLRAVEYSLVSPNGRYFVFGSTAPVRSYDTDGGAVCHAVRIIGDDLANPNPSNRCVELFLYDTQDGSLTCPSCRSDADRPSGDARMAQTPGGGSSLNRLVARSVLDDGTVFFDTPDPLVGADANGTRDVYSSRDGRVTLISRGSQPVDSSFLEATSDGSNVFFVTRDRLVAQDTDQTSDLYDARIGGGLAGQTPEGGPAPCSGDQCREGSAGPTTSAPPASQDSRQPVASPKVATKPRVSILRSSFGTKTLTLMVHVSARGRIRASGGAISATMRTAAKAGTYTLKVPLNRQTRVARKARRRVKIAVKVSLTPPFAAPTATKLTRTLGK